MENKMEKNKEQEEFIKLYSFDQKTYLEIEEEMNIKRKDVQKLYEKTREEREAIQNIRNKFKGKRKEDFNDNFRDFYDWYQSKKQKCGYCAISQEELYSLFREDQKLPLNDAIKRSSGTLEIERKDSTENSYDKKNIILACPLCNNAKSNLIDENDWRNIFVKPMREYYKKILGKDLEYKLISIDV